MFLRIALALQTVVLFTSPITAGVLLTTPSQHALHSASAYSVFGASLVYVVATILAWRPGGGPARPILYSAAFFVLVLAQIALGIAHVTVLHVPLGALLFAVSLLQLSRVWPGRVVSAVVPVARPERPLSQTR